MADEFDPDELVNLPDDTDPNDVLRRLLGPDGGEEVSEPDEDPDDS